MFQKILVAMDNSASAEPVFDTALALAKANSAGLMLIHVLSGEQEGSPNIPITSSLGFYPGIIDNNWEFYQEQWKALEIQGLELLQSQAALSNTAGVNTQFRQLPGSPGRTICDFARTWESDLIVIGRRGRSGLDELFLGSVSNYVLHHAPCSVLTVQHSVKTSTEGCVAKTG